MIITHIDLDNWMAFAGYHEIELPTGPIAVTARYEDNPDRSNWAGKTAFLEAIEWCLFGVHRKRLDDEIIFHGADKVMVRLRLTGDIEVRRSRKRGKATELVVNQVVGEDDVTYVKKQAQAQLEEILGIDNVDYRNTQCFVQDDTLAMVEKTSGERRKVVAQWLELDPWLRVAARATAHQKAIVASYRSVKVDLDQTLKFLHGEAGPEHAKEVLRQELNSATRAQSEAHVESNRAHQTHADAAASLKALEAADSLQEVQAELKVLKSQLTGVGSPEAGLATAREDLATHSLEAARWKRESNEAGGILASGFDGECPVTCSACPVPEAVTSARDSIESRARGAESSYEEAAGLRDGARDKCSGLDEELAAITRKRARFTSLQAEVKRLKLLAKDAVPGLTVEMVEVADRARLAAAQVEREALVQLSQVQEKIKTRKAQADNAETLQEELGAQEDALRLAAIAVKCTGPTGVPGRIAEGALDDLEERANGLLADSGLAFTFAWDRETTSLAPNCPECGYLFKGVKDKSCPACEAHRGWKRADELEILVDDGTGQPEEVKTKSGGAKVLVASAIRLAAGVMLRDLRGSPCAWAQVDEPFGPLDTENRATLARTFAGMLSAVGLEQAFVVSHDAALLDALPHRIEVIRKGDRSVVGLVA